MREPTEDGMGIRRKMLDPSNWLRSGYVVAELFDPTAYAALMRRQINNVFPCSRIVPLDGLSKPAIMRKRVVFPQPDGPSMVKNSLS